MSLAGAWRVLINTDPTVTSRYSRVKMLPACCTIWYSSGMGLPLRCTVWKNCSKNARWSNTVKYKSLYDMGVSCPVRSSCSIADACFSTSLRLLESAARFI